MKKLRILLIEGNARQVLPMARALKELGHEVTTYNVSKTDFGYMSRYPDRKLVAYFDIKDENRSLEAVTQELKAYAYDLIIPMNDDAAILLSKHKSELSSYTSIAVNDWEIFRLSMDKLETMRICMANDIPCPQTVMDIDSFQVRKGTFKYPVVVKPRVGCGAVGFHVSNNETDLKDYYKVASEKFGACLIQEYIPQTDLQYKCEIFIDRNGAMKSAVVFAKARWYPVNGGSSTLNVTVDRPDIIESCHRLLDVIGWRGYADIDLIQDPRDRIAKIIEINPRITGSVKICFKAGVNFARQIVEDFIGDEVTSMEHYKKGVYLRYLQKDILWLIKSPERFSSNPSWFNFHNSCDQIWDWRDPLPFIVSSLEGFGKLRTDSKKRKV